MKKGINNRLGFMQGRLSPIVDGKIQAFPEQYWCDEYYQANRLGFSYMEWTLDFHNIEDNPLLNEEGRDKIVELNNEFQLQVKTLTGDYIMQAPFYKAKGSIQKKLLMLMKKVINAASLVGVEILVVPLVDNGSIVNTEEKQCLLQGMEELHADLIENNMKIAFESDYDPDELAAFINLFDPEVFGINYDIGNSAALGYNWKDELLTYGSYIKNVHIKDRKLNGGTVPLGIGDADILGVINLLESKSYTGLYIFQTARASDDNHISAMNNYRNYILDNFY